MSQEPQEQVVDTPDVATEPQTPQTPTPKDTSDDVASAIRKAQGTAYGHIDAVLQEMGYSKPDGMKTSDFVKSTIDGLSKAQKEKLDKEISKDTNEPNEWEIKAKEYQKRLEQAEEERKNAEKSFYQKQADMMLDTTISSLDIQAPPMDDETKEDYITNQKMAIRARFERDYTTEIINGRVVYKNKVTGEHALGKDGEFAKPTEIIKNSYKSFFIDFSQYNKPNGVRIKDTNNPPSTNTFKSSADIHAHVKSKGLTFGDKAYYDEFNKLAKESGIKI